jgi:hypothetical protein
MNDELAEPAAPPRWVKAFGVIALLLAALFVVLHLTGNSFHGHAPHGEHEDEARGQGGSR